jgi:transforming growth factor-beta-induced protein
VQAKNGVVHVIDKVLLPTSTSRNVVGIATGNTDFSTLVTLLTAADLVTTLGTDDVKTAFTVFAPNNAAFAKVDATTLKCLQEASNKVRVHTRMVMVHMLCVLPSHSSQVYVPFCTLH